jgi:hypothetical protein
LAEYMMIVRSRLEEIAGRDNLDWATITFLEDNLWDHDITATAAGDQGATGPGVYALDLDLFSEEIFWQDEPEQVARFVGDEDNTGGIYIDPGYYSNEVLGQDHEGTAEFAETDAENLFPEADDVPQLHAGELTY